MIYRKLTYNDANYIYLVNCRIQTFFHGVSSDVWWIIDGSFINAVLGLVFKTVE